MPVDPSTLRKIVEHNERLTENVRVMSEQIAKLKPGRCQQSSDCAIAWAGYVEEVLVSLKGQQELSRAMRESARVSDEAQSELFRDRYRFLVDRLKGEVRACFFLLKEYVDLPQDFQRQKTWNDCIYEMEVDLKSLGAISAGETGLASVDALVGLLNYWDKVVTLTLAGILFQKAVLDWDLKNEREFADGPMVEMAGEVVNVYSKTESVPAKLRLQELPKAMAPGPFTYVTPTQTKGDAPTTLTSLQGRIISSLRELTSLDKGLRHMKFAERVHLDMHSKTTGKDSAVEELRLEFIKWSERCTQLQESLRSRRVRKTTGGMEVEAEKLIMKLSEKEQTLKEKITVLHKLEGDWQSLKYDLINQRREKKELEEKINRMSKENIPVLEKMKYLLGKTQGAVEHLVADTAVLSEVFRLQVQHNKNIEVERDNLSNDIASMQQQLKDERAMRKLKEAAVAKKESLYLRTMAARRSINESCVEQEELIESIEGGIAEKQQEMEEMMEVIASKDKDIERMKEELQRATKRTEELRQQQSACIQAYEAATGQPGEKLLANFRYVAETWLPVK